jgi:hypothetical protein
MLLQINLSEELVSRLLSEKQDAEAGAEQDFDEFLENELRDYYSIPPLGWVDDEEGDEPTSEDSDSSETDSEEEAPQLQETGT